MKILQLTEMIVSVVQLRHAPVFVNFASLMEKVSWQLIAKAYEKVTPHIKIDTKNMIGEDLGKCLPQFMLEPAEK